MSRYLGTRTIARALQMGLREERNRDYVEFHRAK